MKFHCNVTLAVVVILASSISTLAQSSGTLLLELTAVAGAFAAAPQLQSSATFTQVVNQADPALRWAAPAPMPFGTPLDSTELSATAKVPGTFVYAPAVGTLLLPGPQTLSVTFTPTDSGYKSSTDSVLLTVIPPGPSSFTLSIPKQPEVIYLLPNQEIAIVLTVTPIGDFHQPVSLACDSPSHITCTFDQSVIRPTVAPILVTLLLRATQRSSGGAQASVGISSMNTSGPRQTQAERKSEARRLPVGLLPIAYLALLLTIRARRELASPLRHLALLSVIAALLPICGAVGCGFEMRSGKTDTTTITASSLVESRSLTLAIAYSGT